MIVVARSFGGLIKYDDLARTDPESRPSVAADDKRSSGAVGTELLEAISETAATKAGVESAGKAAADSAGGDEASAIVAREVSKVSAIVAG